MYSPPEIVDYVISQGPCTGRNPSAMVMGRIKKAQQEVSASGLEMEVQQFIADNGLDDKVAEQLMSCSPDCQVAVLNHGPATGRNPSAMVVGRIKKFNQGGL